MALLLWWAALPVVADDARLLGRVHAFLYEHARSLGEEVVIELHPPRAPLPTCPQPEPFLPHAGRELGQRVSVGVRCGAEGRQVRYLQAEIQVIGSYLEVSHPVARGQRLTAADLVERRGNLGQLPRHTLRDLEEAIGQEATRRLAPGLTLQAHHLKAPTLVARGDRVVVEAIGQGFRVTREAEALESGGRGDRLRLRLPDREMLDARVVGSGRLVVDF